MKNGVNTEMPGRKELLSEVKTLLAAGRITEEDINRMIRPSIATGIAFGLYERKKYLPEWLDKYPQHEQTAYDVAAEGIVLLKNNGILPLRTGRRYCLPGVSCMRCLVQVIIRQLRLL